MRILAVLILMSVALLAYIRLAPSDPQRWSQPIRPLAVGDHPSATGFVAVREVADPAILHKLTEVALATPRTSLLAGSADEGRVTFVTRSALMGYPDYTTAEWRDNQFAIWGRQRFGQGDLGVNKARILGWLAVIGL